MKNRFIYIIFLLPIFVSLSSCTNHSELLRMAESVMYERPDSALVILNSISSPESFRGKDRADYCLLMTQARLKNYMGLESDSMINIAFDYYQNKNDNEKKVLAYYCKGVYYYDKKEYVQSTSYFKKAEELLLITGNPDMLGLVFFQLGHINLKQKLYERALYYYKRSLYNSQLIGNLPRIVTANQQIANTFYFLQQPDSIDYYCQKALLYVEDANDRIKSGTYHNVGLFYLRNKEYDKSLPYFLKSLEVRQNEKNIYRTYTLIAEVYYGMGKYDLANQYWDKSLETDNIHIKQVIYYALYNKSISERNYDDLVEYSEKFIECTDSITKLLVTESVLEMQEKYDNESLRSKQYEYESHIYKLCSLLCLFIIISILLFLGMYSIRVKSKRKIEKIIQLNESDLNRYKSTLSELEEKMSSDVLANDSILKERDSLSDKIKYHENEIERYKNKLHFSMASNEQVVINESVTRGIRMYAALNPQRDKMPLLTTSDFTDIIRFYKIYDEPFISFLMKEEFHLTTLERVICILFRMKLSNKQVADCLGNTSATLARSKTRIKKKKFRLIDDRRLEDYINSVTV